MADTEIFPKILILDDDKLWRGNLVRFFSLSGFLTAEAEDCASGMAALMSLRPDCVLLDFHMRDGDGGAFCLRLRETSGLGRTPVVMVSADPAEELNAYGVYKADGFILKGCPLEKILAVTKAVLRRVALERGALEAGDLRLEPDGCRLLRKGRLAAVLPQEQFRLLSLLMEAAPEPMAEARISEQLLGVVPEEGRADAVYSLVYRLRQSLGPQLAKRVKNISGKGWLYDQPCLRRK